MDLLPENTYLTAKHCNRFCGILIMDGKYIKVRGYAQKIPFIYAIDYLTHDIPVGILAPSESEESFRKFFRLLKTCNYPLQIVVCDDVLPCVKPGLFYYYPKAKIQLCQNHYVEKIRQALNVRTKEEHQRFFAMLYKGVFKESRNGKELQRKLFWIMKKRAQRNEHRQMILMNVHHRSEELFAYQKITHCPKDTNLLELFNSHLNARLKSIKGFKSFHAAERWLNGYLIRRRTKKFTDCDEKFKRLNGKCSIEMTRKRKVELPEIQGVRALNQPSTESQNL